MRFYCLLLISQIHANSWIPNHIDHDPFDEAQRKDIVIQNSDISGALNVLDEHELYGWWKWILGFSWGSILLTHLANNIGQTMKNSSELIAKNIMESSQQQDIRLEMILKSLKGVKTTNEMIGNNILTASNNQLESSKEGLQDVGAKISKVAESIDESRSSFDMGVIQVEGMFDDLENTIKNTQGMTNQLSAINRLSNKIECTEDCYTSANQADAIIKGLQSNDKNIYDLIKNINNAARNSKPRNKRSNETNKNEAKFFAEMVDAAIALQNPAFNFTKNMASKGYSFETLSNSLKSNSSSQDLREFIKEANMSVQLDTDTQIDLILRKRRDIETIGEVTLEFIKLLDNFKSMKSLSMKHDEAIIRIRRQGVPNPLIETLVKPLVGQAAELLNTLLGAVQGEISNILEAVNGLLTPIFTTVNDFYNLQLNLQSNPTMTTTANPAVPASIADIGLGQKVKFKYPWNPDLSPIICKQAQEEFGTAGGNEYWNDSDGYPGEKCNEFIFSKSKFNEVSRHVDDIIKQYFPLSPTTRTQTSNRNPIGSCYSSSCEANDSKKICWLGQCLECHRHNQCVNPDKLKCNFSTNQCATGNYLGEFMTMRLANREVYEEMEDTDNMLENIAGTGVIPQLYANSRRDYVSLLNANTLSLDAIASLNGALREIQKTETYENQEHVQWLTGEMVSLFDAIVPL